MRKMSSSVSESTLSSEPTPRRSLSISVPGFSLFEGTLFSSTHPPQGLAALVESLAREVLRSRPNDIYSFAAHHFDYLLRSRINRTIAGEKGARSESTTTLDHNYRRCNPRNSKKKSNTDGWSIRETSRILNREPVASYESQSHTESSQQREQRSKASTRGPPSSLSGGTAGKHLPTDADAYLSQAQKEIIRPRDGSFEFVDVYDTNESQETTRLLRSLSFDCILPQRMYTTSLSKKIHHSTNGIDTARCTSATTSDVSSLGIKAKDDTNKRESIFLPAVRTVKTTAGCLYPAALQSPTPTSSSSSSSSCCSSSSPTHPFPSRDPLKGYPVGDTTSPLTLPLIKYEPAKSVKKCNAILFPAVATKPSASVVSEAGSGLLVPLPAVSIDSITKLEGVEPSTEENQAISFTDKDASNKHLEMNELGKKLLELQTVERNIERTLVLGGVSDKPTSIMEKLVDTKDGPRHWPAENAQGLSDPSDRSDDFSDKFFGDHLCPPTDHGGRQHPSQQLDRPLASIELDEIVEEAEDESVERSEYKSRGVVNGIAAGENSSGRAALIILNATTSSSVHAQQNKCRALEDIIEREEKDEKALARVNISRETTNFETKASPDGTEADADDNDDELLERRKMNVPPVVVVDRNDDSTFEEEIAKELIENGRYIPETGKILVNRSESDTTFLQVNSSHRQTLDTESERSTTPSPRVCHTGEFHDSLPLHLLSRLDQIDSIYAHQATSTSFSSDETTASEDQTSSRKMSGLHRGSGSSLSPSSSTSSQVVPPLGRDEQESAALSSATTSKVAHLSVIPLIHSVIVRKHPQDEAVALSTLLRAVHTGFGMIDFAPLINLSPRFYSMPANVYTLFQDSTPSSLTDYDTTLAIDDITPLHGGDMGEESPIEDTSLSNPTTNSFSSEEIESYLDQLPSSDNANSLLLLRHDQGKSQEDASLRK